MAYTLTLILACLAVGTQAYNGNYYCSGGTDVVVHLFEWKWRDIASECENFLSGAGYCAVQQTTGSATATENRYTLTFMNVGGENKNKPPGKVYTQYDHKLVSPPNEHRIVTNPAYPWYQRYQPVSYRMGSRSGPLGDFTNMVSRCNAVGVRIYVDAVINHMTGGGSGVGSDGSFWNADIESFPDFQGDVWSTNDDFHGHPECPTGSLNIENYGDATQVRYCRLLGLRDLRLSKEYVRNQIAGFLNNLIGWGVAGFRIDAAKHMEPGDINNIVGRLNNLPTNHGFPTGTKPYIYMEVIDMGGEPITASQYTYIGRVTEFKYGKDLGDVIRGNDGQRLAYLRNFGTAWGHMSATSALTFVDNHDNQRGHGAGGFGSILTFFESNMYKMANAFMLAWDYGHVRIMSSYNWPRNIVGGVDQNDWVGPPSDANGNTNNAVCFNGDWICEHRWRQISNMVRFHNAALGQSVTNWWDDGNNAIAFSRGNRGFFVMSKSVSLNRNFNTGLPDGIYCDVISCANNRPPCGTCEYSRQSTISVSGGWANVQLSPGTDPMMAFHA